GNGDPFDKATLARLYPGGKADYMGRFTRALDTAIRAGHLLREDRQEILDIAAIRFDAAS
ncbi:MAG: alpha/beta hydrolase domain-containing protein, partial [Novosphingobium sp.]